METVEDIIDDMRYAARLYLQGGSEGRSQFEMLDTYADRLEIAHHHEVNRLLKIDNSCVAQCAVLLDDHIKALVANVKRGANGNR